MQNISSGRSDSQGLQNTAMNEGIDDEYVIDKLVWHRCTTEGMQYCVRGLGYDPTEDTYEPAK